MKQLNQLYLLSLSLLLAVAFSTCNQSEQSIDLSYSATDSTQQFSVADSSVYLTQFGISTSIDFQEFETLDGTLKLTLFLELPGDEVLNPLLWDVILVGSCDGLRGSRGPGAMLEHDPHAGGDSVEVSLELSINISGNCDALNDFQGGLSIVLETMDPAGSYHTGVKHLSAIYETSDGVEYPVNVSRL